MKHSGLRLACLAIALSTLALALGGCVIRRTRPVAPEPVVVAQPSPVVVAQPAPVVVSPPAPVVVAPAPSPQASSGVISYPYERVRYPLSVPYTRAVNIYVNGYGLDPTVSVYDGYGNRIGFNDDGGSGLDSHLMITLPAGSYVVEVAGYSSSTGSFTLTVQ